MMRGTFKRITFFFCWFIFFIAKSAPVFAQESGMNCLLPSERSNQSAYFVDATWSDFKAKTHADSLEFFAKKVLTLQRIGEIEKSYQWVLEALKFPDFVNNTFFSIYAGNSAYVSGDLLTAMFCYRHVLKSAKRGDWDCLSDRDSSILISMAHLNIGTTYIQLKQSDSAIYYLEKVSNPVSRELLMNNLASIYMRKGQYEEALKYLGTLDKYEMSQMENALLTRMNLMTCYLHLNQQDKADEMYKTVNTEFIPFGDTTQSLLMLFDYYIVKNDTVSFLGTVNAYHGFLVRESLNKSAFSLALRMKQVYQQSPDVFRFTWKLWLQKLKIQDTQPSPWAVSLKYNKIVSAILQPMGIAASGLVMTIAFLLGVRSNDSKRIKLIKEFPSNEEGATETELFFKGMSQEEMAFFKSLTVKELNLVRWVVAGKVAKQMAQQMDCSVGHIYNMRSAIRKNFEATFPDLQFEDWVKNKMM